MIQPVQGTLQHQQMVALLSGFLNWMNITTVFMEP